MATEDIAPELGTADLPSSPTRVRYVVLAFLGLLSFVLYIDRVCISQAVVPIQNELQLSNTTMGMVLGAFTVAYGLFEVPTGRWGDRYGSRGVLTRIVLWWSVFTALTGAATGAFMLIAVRFLFGAGEAGAMPNTCRVLARWFPPFARGPAQGFIVTSAQIGGAIAPVVAQGLIESVGWRASFVIFGGLGLIWAAAFYLWYRDDPAEHPAVNEAERRYIAAGEDRSPLAENHPAIPWGCILSSRNVWLLGAIMTCGAFASYMYMSWYPKYLQSARDVSPALSSWLASLVLAGGAVGGLLGGYLSDWVIQRMGSRSLSRRLIGVTAFAIAALALLASIRCSSPVLATICVALACLTAQVQLSSWWSVATEISGQHIGVMFGLMNSMGVPGAFASQVFFGWLADVLHAKGYVGRAQWDPGFYVYAIILLVGAFCWFFVDPTRSAVVSSVPLQGRREGPR